MDIMFVNAMTNLTEIDRTTRYQSLVCHNSLSAKKIYKGIDSTYRQYNISIFLIKEINCYRKFNK